MNIITEFIIEEEGLPSIIFKGNCFYIRFYQSGNGDVYLSSLDINNNNNYFIPFSTTGEDFKYNLIALFENLNTIYNSDFTAVYSNKNNFNITKNKLSWLSDESDEYNFQPTLDMDFFEDGLQLRFNKNPLNKNKDISICFNTDRGNCREISLNLYLFLRTICNKNKIL